MINKLRIRFLILTSLIVFIVSFLIGITLIITNYININNRANNISYDLLNSEEEHFNRNIIYFIIKESNNEVVLEESRDYFITIDNYISYYNKITNSSCYVDNYRCNTINIDDTIYYVFINQYIELQGFYNNISLIVTIMLITNILVFILNLILSKKIISSSEVAYQKQKQFITNASHELKTPITIISANNELIKYKYSDNEYSSTIEHEVSRLNVLINKMIKQAKLDEEYKLNITRFDLSSVSLELTNMFSLSLNNITLNTNITKDIFIDADLFLINELLVILLDNANKYCDEGGCINFSIYKKRKVYISVKNTYRDVNSLDLENLFERFYKGNINQNNNSYGLGLSIAKDIVYKHKGSIKANSLENEIEFLIKL